MEDLKPRAFTVSNGDTCVCVCVCVCGLWVLECGEWRCSSVFFLGLTAHETALLISAALMVVSFPPDQWTLTNKWSLTHYIYSIQMKSDCTNTPQKKKKKKKKLPSHSTYTKSPKQSYQFKGQYLLEYSSKNPSRLNLPYITSAFYYSALRPGPHDAWQHSRLHYVVLFRGEMHRVVTFTQLKTINQSEMCSALQGKVL